STSVAERLAIKDEVDKKIELRPNWSEDELQIVFKTAYEQVFGRQMKTVGFNRIFELYRGRANSDNAQFGGKSARLRSKISMNLANTIVPPTSPIAASTSSARTLVVGMFIVEAIAGTLNTNVAVRRSRQVYTVPYDRLSATYQEIHKRGGKIVKITPAS
nr:linker protein [Mastigocladus laminosus]